VFFASVNDTGDKLFKGVNCGVNDTGDKLLSPVMLLLAIN
jgi:hypothetical protein